MSSAAEPFKINLNQNLWGLLVGFGALGLSEHYELCTLYWFSFVVSLIMIASIAVTTMAYTRHYWKAKEG